jgi:hypothetical protein
VALRHDVCGNDPQDMSAELTRDGLSEDGSNGDQPHHKRAHVDTPVDPVDGYEEEEEAQEEDGCAQSHLSDESKVTGLEANNEVTTSLEGYRMNKLQN